MTGRRAAASFTRAATVGPEWIDYNGHMADFAYSIAFSETVTAYMDAIGLDAASRAATGGTLYTLDMRTGYLRECHEGDALSLTLHVLEQVLLHVSQAGGQPKAAAFPAEVAALLALAVSDSAEILPLPHIERRIGLSRS
jgi:acyl-CoA thioester hydrolase